MHSDRTEPSGAGLTSHLLQSGNVPYLVVYKSRRLWLERGKQCGAWIAERVSALDRLSLRCAAIITLRARIHPLPPPRLVHLSKALYHTCFICGQRCKCWSRRPQLTSSVISDDKAIIYIYIYNKWQERVLRSNPGWLLFSLSGKAKASRRKHGVESQRVFMYDTSFRDFTF